MHPVSRARFILKYALSATQSPLHGCMGLLSATQRLLAVVHGALEYYSKVSRSSARSS